MDKKKIVLYAACGLLGVLSALYLYVVIHTNFISRPVAADGSSSAYNYMKYQRDLEKEELER